MPAYSRMALLAELSFLVRVIQKGGTPDIPSEMISTYLEIQSRLIVDSDSVRLAFMKASKAYRAGRSEEAVNALVSLEKELLQPQS